MQPHPKLSLITHLRQLPDPRVRGRCEHERVDVLMIALCCLLCGGEGFNDMEDFGRAKRQWFGTFLRLRSGIPTHDTFNRVLAALKPEAFLEVFMAWTQSLRATVAEEIVALDGKALRRALDRGDSARVIVSAWATSNSLVLGQIAVPDKTNEITAVPKLLRAGTLRLHRHARRDGLPERDRQGNQGSRRRVCAGAQRQPGPVLRRDQELPR